MNVIFVTTNNRTSGIHRGVDAARITGGVHVDCSYANKYKTEFHLADVVVHVKFRCPAAFILSTATHVYDRVDSVRRVNMTSFASEIVSCKKAAATSCRAPFCTAIPHHINLNCSIHTDAQKYATTVGFVGKNIHIPTDLKYNLTDYTIMHERNFRHPCQFFDKTDIAVSWRKPMQFLPQERFTNPIYFNIPTIGTSYHPSFVELDEERHFICSDSTCVRSKIELIRNGKLKYEFRSLRQKVMNYVSSDNVRQLYMQAFRRSIDADSRHIS